MKKDLVSRLLGTNLGGILFVIIPTVLTYFPFFSITYSNIENKLISMQNFELFRITISIIVLLFSWVVLLLIRLRLKQSAIIDYADLLREDAAEINNYSNHCAQNRILQIQAELQQRGIISAMLPDVITDEEKRLHDELGRKRQERQIELYELITGKKYESNRD